MLHTMDKAASSSDAEFLTNPTYQIDAALPLQLNYCCKTTLLDKSDFTCNKTTRSLNSGSLQTPRSQSRRPIGRVTFVVRFNWPYRDRNPLRDLSRLLLHSSEGIR